MARKKKTRPAPFRPCGMCHNGFVLCFRKGERAVARCVCWLNRNRPSPGVDAKTMAAGQ